MNRGFFMIDSDAMQRHGIKWNDGSTDIAKALGNGKGILEYESLVNSFPFIDKTSTSLMINPENMGAVVGWDFNDNEAMACYYGRFRNHPAIYFLEQYGQSVDAPAMIEKGLSANQKATIKSKVSFLIDNEKFGEKSIADFTYEDFVHFVKHETNYYGETSSAFLALSVGNGFFAQDAKRFKESGISSGNYNKEQTKYGMIMDAFDYIAREFPGQLAVEKDPFFLNGPNKEVNRGPIVRSSVARGLLKEALDTVSRLSTPKTPKIQG